MLVREKQICLKEALQAGINISPVIVPSGLLEPAARWRSERTCPCSPLWFHAPTRVRWLLSASHVSTSDPATGRKVVYKMINIIIPLRSSAELFLTGKTSRGKLLLATLLHTDGSNWWLKTNFAVLLCSWLIGFPNSLLIALCNYFCFILFVYF